MPVVFVGERGNLAAMADARNPIAPPLPAPVLSLGVTGHRVTNASLAANQDRIAAVIEHLFAAIAAAAGLARVRLHSLMADGADQMAAQAGLGRGWAQVAPLPFGRALNRAINARPETLADAQALLAGNMAQDPATAARAAALDDLLARSHVLDLADADPPIEALFLAALAVPTDVALAQKLAGATSRRVALAGRVMIEQSDLVIAVWDGANRDAVGGTGHTIANALLAGASVVLIDARAPETWRLVSELEALHQPAAPDTDRDAGLARIVAAALRPPGDAAAEAQALAPEAWRARSNPLFHTYRRVEALFGGGRPFRSLTQVHEPPEAIATGSGAALLASLAALPGADPAWPRAIGTAVLQRFAWADGISTRYSDLYRGGMVANFIASSLSVLVGLAYMPTTGPAWKHVFATAEFLLLATIVITTALGRSGHWHDRWFSTRRAAEYLRHAPFLLALGVMRPPGRWPKAHGHGDTWPEHHARQALREVGLPAATITQAWLRAVLDSLLIPHLAGQRDYHLFKAARLEQVHHRLDRVSSIAFQLAVLAVALWLVMWAGCVVGLLPHDLAESTAKIFTFLGVLFPTIGGGVAGIRYFGDFDRFAAISRVSADKLDVVLRRARLLAAAPLESLDFGRVADLAHAGDDVVVSEIESWQAVFAGKNFTVPV